MGSATAIAFYSYWTGLREDGRTSERTACALYRTLPCSARPPACGRACGRACSAAQHSTTVEYSTGQDSRVSFRAPEEAFKALFTVRCRCGCGLGLGCGMSCYCDHDMSRLVSSGVASFGRESFWGWEIWLDGIEGIEILILKGLQFAVCSLQFAAFLGELRGGGWIWTKALG